MTYYAPHVESAPAPGEPIGPVRLAWIGEAWRLFAGQAGQWIVGQAIACGLTILFAFGVAFLLAIPITMSAMGTVSGGAGVSTVSGMPSMTGIYALVGVTGLVVLALQAIFFGGFMKMAIKCMRGEFIQGSDVFSGYSVAIPMFLLLLLLTGLPTVGNFVYRFGRPSPTDLLPVIAASVLSSFAVHLVSALIGVVVVPAMALVADGVSVSDSLRRSFSGIRRVAAPTYGLYVLFVVIYFLSFIPLFLGTMVTVPMFFLIGAITARERVGLPIYSPGTYESFAARESQAGDTATTGVWPPAPVFTGQPVAAEPPPPQADTVDADESGD